MSSLYNSFILPMMFVLIVFTEMHFLIHLEIKFGLVFCVPFKFYFSDNSLLLYFTKILVWGWLEVEKRNPWWSPSDSLSSAVSGDWVLGAMCDATGWTCRWSQWSWVVGLGSRLSPLEPGCPFSEGMTFPSPRQETHGQTCWAVLPQTDSDSLTSHEPSQKGSHFWQIRDSWCVWSPLALHHQDINKKDI